MTKVHRLTRWILSPGRWINAPFERWNERRLRNIQTGSLNSSTRDEWVAEQLTKLPPNFRLLDAGAGEQRYRKYCGHLHYVSQDHEAYDGRGDGVGGHVRTWLYGKTDIVCDIAQIPEPDASFDAVLCTEVLEHVPDPAVVLSELARLTRPGGRLILSAPFGSFTHFAPYHFCTGLSRYWYEHHLPKLGFVNIEAVPNGNFFEFLAQEIRRLPQMADEYSEPLVSKGTALASLALLADLSRLSKKDVGSGLYACFGWHVTAEKSR
jgi:SAM-dependent methyltransferase